MRDNLLILLLVVLVVLSVGCTSTRGLIDLHSRPREATVFLDGIKQGITPVQFEYDFKTPARLEIIKEGFYVETELLNQAWVIREIRKGNYSEGYYTIGGVSAKTWMVSTYRRLQKKEE
jgi:hypothetical protein